MDSSLHCVKQCFNAVYSALDLSESELGFCESPRVLSVLASLLERVVRKDEKLLETTKKQEKLTVFHGLRAPNLSIRSYIDRIFKYSNCSPSCFILAYVYIDRFIHQQPEFPITSLNVHRLLITSIMVAAKFIDDAFFNNAYYARVGGVSTVEINRLELEFLFNLDFKLQVTVDTFESYCLLCEREVAGSGSYRIERPLQFACGLNGLNNKEETQAQSVAPRCTYGAV
uniref:Cyclin n=1 Tax=Araucaria cunninghamii TaxID=56994 RepID=A0A0D6R3J9_ARACU